MSDIEQETPLVTDIGDEEAEGPESLMEQLRDRRRELAATKETLITIPGFEDSGLACKYRLMDRQETEKIGKRIRKLTKDRGDFQMLVLVDILIHACEGFWLRREGEVVPLKMNDGNGAPRIERWDQLASFMGYEAEVGEKPPDQRVALYYVFGDNEFAVGQHAIALNRWFANTGVDVDVEFLGEVI